MATDIKYSKKQLTVMMERYTEELLRPHAFADLPLTLKYDVSVFGSSVSCHLRTTEGVMLKVDELVEWFHKLGSKEQEAMLEVVKSPFQRGK